MHWYAWRFFISVASIRNQSPLGTISCFCFYFFFLFLFFLSVCLFQWYFLIVKLKKVYHQSIVGFQDMFSGPTIHIQIHLPSSFSIPPSQVPFIDFKLSFIFIIFSVRFLQIRAPVSWKTRYDHLLFLLGLSLFVSWCWGFEFVSTTSLIPPSCYISLNFMKIHVSYIFFLFGISELSLWTEVDPLVFDLGLSLLFWFEMVALVLLHWFVRASFSSQMQMIAMSLRAEVGRALIADHKPPRKDKKKKKKLKAW